MSRGNTAAEFGFRARVLLRAQGVIAAADFAKSLEISRSTLSRWVASQGGDIVRIGKTSATQYGLKRELPGVGAEFPVFEVSEGGKVTLKTTLTILFQSHFVMNPEARVYSGLPPEVFDMTPQGFMGRAFANRFSAELGLPQRLDDWSNDHLLIAILKRGEDLPGNLILGFESAERWAQQMDFAVSERSQYPVFARQALSGQPIGSSAGGERPKFASYVDGCHRLVKFIEHEGSMAQQRWSDLLVCEAIALECLAAAGVHVARAQLIQEGRHTFLEVERFDRIGPRGRRAVMTLAAIDNERYGARDSWSAMAERMERTKIISPGDAEKMRFLDAFGALIGDSDRHFHNLCFFPGDHYALAPAFDKLPMLYAPVSGQVVERPIVQPIPGIHSMRVWDEARSAAREFWGRASMDARISVDFRRIAEKWKRLLM